MSLQRQAWRARAFQWAAALSNRLQRLPNRLVPAPFRLMQIGSAFWQSRALYVAAKLDVATVLANDRVTLTKLATRLEVDRDALFRLLRLLTSMGIFELDRDGRIANNVLSQPLRTDSDHCVRNMVLMHNSPEMARPWFEKLEDGVRTGQVPFLLCHGQFMYDYMDSHAQFDALFSRAMDEVESLGGDSFATAFDWSTFDRIIDVGGSKAAKSAAILRRHPHLQVVVVDRPQVIAQARSWWAAKGDPSCRDRIEFTAGDAVNGALPPATSDRDVYLLSAVLHGFDDATSAAILGHVETAVGQTGASIVLLEMVVPEHDVDTTSASFDMQMFMGTRGRERSMTEWKKVFELTDLYVMEVVKLATFGRMLVLRRRPSS